MRSCHNSTRQKALASLLLTSVKDQFSNAFLCNKRWFKTFALILRDIDEYPSLKACNPNKDQSNEPLSDSLSHFTFDFVSMPYQYIHFIWAKKSYVSFVDNSFFVHEIRLIKKKTHKDIETRLSATTFSQTVFPLYIGKFRTSTNIGLSYKNNNNNKINTFTFTRERFWCIKVNKIYFMKHVSRQVLCR